jgi:hypothetical protein
MMLPDIEAMLGGEDSSFVIGRRLLPVGAGAPLELRS